MDAANAKQAGAVVLFDGVCNLCNGAVNFIIDRDPSSYFHFAALQSEQAAALLAPLGRVPEVEPQSFILVEDGEVYERSTAALRIARRLGGGWVLLYAFMVVPRVLRDAVYRLVARNRYRMFGKADSCRMPTPELRARFL
ncbi:thiol-disulfide oxidoreductase DCC family protein [Myxococcus xanthus]|uniref:Thiol-disulfide oxidoreductase DCC n=1 Tax=Myxococcus xanthus TaxID=34 RepID=A0AAE6KVZ5_MYXXA|nr:thiol-disulfide oxidoreductase DCC family protein [Myxococcus xanthus]QDE71635.1 thiol-disulfide oxidoreductase DCC [Myxococcus xanthus]QDE78916.1 thiol-disulfide oxidoreductase DCC [Myxococcus xanthus]QDE86289.1 thiol-disulfide oxidoreductase DCC [Myxococcus xanthus]QDE93300.1 thiol-disulfide oxidoreductase DCC [Myxococcus xanthus]QDF08248.1 thiol-disulfide oxidoreductase DCC [Myxococcus xanthus]